MNIKANILIYSIFNNIQFNILANIKYINFIK